MLILSVFWHFKNLLFSLKGQGGFVKKYLFLVFFLAFSSEVFGQICPDFQEVRPDVYVAKDVSGWYVNIGSNSTNQLAVARCFYQRYPERDHYDFLWIDQTSWNSQQPHTYSVAGRSTGIGPVRFDISWNFGSRGRLSAISWDKRGFADPIGRPNLGSADNQAWNTLNHEFSHHACCYYDYNRTDASDLFPSASVGVSMSNGHLSPWLGTISDLKTEPVVEGLMEDLPYVVDASGKAIYQVPRGERLRKASAFTAYTLGFILPTEVRGKFPVIKSTVWDSQTETVRGEVKRWADVDELISLQWGRRWPEAGFSQRHFRAALILLVDMHDSDTLKVGIDKWVNQFIESTNKVSEKWQEAMSGRSTLNDPRFKIPRLRTDKPQFAVGELLTVRLAGADPNMDAELFVFDGINQYVLPLQTKADGTWEFTASMGPDQVGQWSAIVYFGLDRETGGLTHTTSNLLYFEVVVQKK